MKYWGTLCIPKFKYRETLYIVFHKIVVSESNKYSKANSKMEAALSLYCRCCERAFQNRVSRSTHEKKFHHKEREANAQPYTEIDSINFNKCDVCSIHTSRDVYTKPLSIIFEDYTQSKQNAPCIKQLHRHYFR